MTKSLFGYANTTKAIAKSGGWCIYDDKFDKISSDEWGNTLLPSSEFKAQLSGLEIPSPGFAPTHELIKKAKNLISEYDYFYLNGMPKSVWISGTNGKTTTTKMTQFLLESKGVQMGGNVGIAVADLDKTAPLWILETSSFTMHYTKHAKPNIYALLPITPDHLSWHGNMSEYEKAKLKPLLNMCEQDLAIIPAIFKEHEFSKNSKAKIYFYNNENDLADIFGIESQKIHFKVPFLMDAIFALVIEKIIFGLCNYELINTFVIENNKLEELRDSKNRLWVNDTKATNIDACLKAIERYKEHEILIILGGDDKGVDLSPVFGALSELKIPAKIYAIGSNTDKIIEFSKKFKLEFQACYELKTAVKKIDEMLGNSGCVALLSPACASLDQFSSYAQRGEIFKEEIAKLK